MDEVKLFRKNVNSLGTWRIWSEGDTIRIAHATVIGGSEVVHSEVVSINLSGRSLQEQVDLRMRSRISRMLDKGYKTTMFEAQSSSSNQLGLDRPMLAQTENKVPNVDRRGSVLQKKLDGHRCLTTLDSGEPLAYSRQGKPIPAIKHILRALQGRLPPDVTIDGELYCHGVKLQTIGSWIKREQPETANLYYVVYDIISRDRYVDRHRELSEIIAGADTMAPGKIVALPYRPWVDHEEQARYFSQVRAEGFEGLMLRLDNRGYESGRRSSSLLKIKDFDDAEFTVVGFEESKTGWAICQCITDDGRPFNCAAPGSVEDKTFVWLNQDKFLRRRLKIQFAHWTDDKVPFQPVALCWEDEL